MDYLESIREGEQALRAIEGSSKKYGPPEGMNHHSWIIDRGYLLYSLRLYARKVFYELWARKSNIDLEEAAFSGMKAILAYREKEIKQDVSLQAFLRVIAALRLDPGDKSTPFEYEGVLVYLLNKRGNLDREDYVYLAAYLAGFANTAINKGEGSYHSVALRSEIAVIEGKYGKGWKSGDQPLAYRYFTNLTMAVLRHADHDEWRGLSMDLIPELGENGSAYEWIEEFVKAYRSRLEKEYRKPSVAYVRAQSAFYRKSYVEASKQLRQIGDMPFGFFGMQIRRYRLMIYYELLYCQSNTRAEARKLEPDARGTISSMRNQIRDLDSRQERKTYQLEHYTTFINGFSALLSVREKADKLPENSQQRFSFLVAEKPKILNLLTGYDHISGRWIRRKVKDMN